MEHSVQTKPLIKIEGLLLDWSTAFSNLLIEHVQSDTLMIDTY